MEKLENDPKASSPRAPIDVNKALRMLRQLKKSWYHRAQVRENGPDLVAKNEFKHDKDDFLPSLLPFATNPLYENLPPHLQRQILSCGWLVYNQKTLDIESKIINPACLDLLENKIPGTNYAECREIVSETMVDESYHILLVVNACDVTRKERQLEHIRFHADFSLVNMMEKHKAECDSDWKRRIVQLATATVSEVFISNYLSLISDAYGIQPLNQMTVQVHRQDELSHSQIFSNLTKCIYGSLSNQEKAFYAEMLPKPVKWFADLDLAVWSDILHQLHVPCADQLIKDSQAENENACKRIDYSELLALSEEAGISEMSNWTRSADAEGLVN